MEPGVCRSCGRPLQPDHVDFLLVETGDAETVQTSGSDDVGGGSRRGLAVAAGLAAVLGAMGLVALVSGPADDTAPEAQPQVTPVSGEGDPPAAPGPVAPEDVALLGGFELAYLADGAIVIVDLASDSPTLEVVPELVPSSAAFFDLAALDLLSVDDTSFGISSVDGYSVQRLSNRGQLVPVTADVFTIAPSEASPRQLLVATSAGYFMSPLEVPAGSTELVVPGVGILILPPTGQTYLARPGRYELFSESQVLAATPTHQVENRCEDDLTCTPVLVDIARGTVRPLPDLLADPGSDISLSPDGGWLLVVSSTLGAQLYDTATGELEGIDRGPTGTVAWAPDSSFFAWLDPESDAPRLQLVYPGRQHRAEIDLAALGGTHHLDEAIVVFGG